MILVSVVFTSSIKASFSENVTGWLWGGGTESDGSEPWDGNNTNVGWISTNNLNCDANDDGSSDGTPFGCPASGTSMARYGINIPNENGVLSGYGWSENIGWVSFNAGDVSSCPTGKGACNARRVENRLEGWARIIAIRDAALQNNAGGWQGWISLSGVNYGIVINPNNTLGGYAWSDELGWIDFSRAKINKICNISSASGTLLNAGNRCRPISASVSDNDLQQTLTFSKTTGNIKLSQDDKCAGAADTPVSCTVPVGSTSCSVFAFANDQALSEGGASNVSITSTGCGAGNLAVTVEKRLSCTISAPDSILVPAGSYRDYDVTVGGESGCVLDSCSITSGSNKISSQKLDADTCRVTADADARYETAVSTARSSSATADTKVNVKAPGWIETNP